MEDNKQQQTVVKNFYGGIYFDRCQMTDIKFQTIVQGDMHVEAEEAHPIQDDGETTEAEQKMLASITSFFPFAICHSRASWAASRPDSFGIGATAGEK